MSNTKVYHAINPTFGFGATKHKFPEDFKFVAEINSDNLDDIYNRTQNAFDSWVKGDGVISIEDSARSTSIGDVIVLPNGKRYECKEIGWGEI